MDRDILLACRDASLGYEHRALLEHLTFTVRAGDYLCVVGENGSGKSTLMKSLLGLLPPLAGTIDCPAQRAGAIGYLPQQTSAQRDFPATVSEVVLSGFANKRGLHFFYSAAEKSAALMNMGKLGVLELQNRCYRELSGGQQQRVLLARALCAADRLLILDEPVTGLDPAATQDLYKTLRYLNEKEKMAVIMVTHDMRGALREALGERFGLDDRQTRPKVTTLYAQALERAFPELYTHVTPLVSREEAETAADEIKKQKAARGERKSEKPEKPAEGGEQPAARRRRKSEQE